MDLELKELEQFNGTENYFKVLGTKVTEGVIYIMQNGYSWLVTDFLVVAKTVKFLKAQEFLTLNLKLEGNKGTMKVTDGNNKLLYTQDYELTDAKKEVKLYFTDDVLMLAGEY